MKKYSGSSNLETQMCTEYYSAQYKLGRMTANVEITIIKKKMEKRASVCAYNQPKRLAVQHIWLWRSTTCTLITNKESHYERATDKGPIEGKT